MTERFAADGATQTIKSQHIYLGSLEMYEEFSTTTTSISDSAGRTLYRETVSLKDGAQRFLTVDRTPGTNIPSLTKYLVSNHIGSCSIELDEQANVVSYEEYTPYGSTSYQGVRDSSLPAKRYGFTGHERDEESEFYYQGLRYYMPWLGRWTSAEPAGLADGPNVYCYVSCQPISLSDLGGTEGEKDVEVVGIGGAEFKGTESREEVMKRVEQTPWRVEGEMHWEGKTPVFEHLWYEGAPAGQEGGTGTGGGSDAGPPPASQGGGRGASGGGGSPDGTSPTGSSTGSPDGAGSGKGGNPHGSWWDRAGRR